MEKVVYLSVFALFIVVVLGSLGVHGEEACSIILCGTVDEPDTPVEIAMSENASDHARSGDCTWDSANVTNITLNDDSISVDGTGVTVAGTIATITAGGDYLLSGTLNDGRIIVDSDDDLIVRLILNGINITSSTNAPISVNNAEKTVIILADDSVNTVTDPASYIFENPTDDEPNVAVFSKDNLSVCGCGSLIINANYNDGLASKDGLVINGGNLSIYAVDDGIRGKDYLVVKTGTITINAGGDALKADNDSDPTMGYILIEDGSINLTSTSADGFDAETDVLIKNGTITVTTGRGSGVKPGVDSTKGIKGTQCVIIDNGTFTINSSDDTIHSNTDILLDNGNYTLSTGDDAIHGDTTVVINNGSFNILKSVEGIESNSITFNGGAIHVAASDDAVNSTAGSDVEGNDGSYTYINGGYNVLTVTDAGDGLDSNGNIAMTDGTVIIHGPSRDPEVAVDYNGTFKISGGLLIGAGSSSNMTQAPSSSSSQNSLKVKFNTSLSASTLFHLQTSAGNDVITFQPAHQYQSIVFSSSAFEQGQTYSIYTGGTYNGGVNNDGVYSGGSYSGGKLYKTFNVTQRVTEISGTGGTGGGPHRSEPKDCPINMANLSGAYAKTSPLDIYAIQYD